MEGPQVRLAFQRAGSETWVDIDPSNPEGRRMLALFDHPKENPVMTTTAGRVNQRPTPTTSVRDPETGERWVNKDGIITLERAGFFGGLLAKARGFFGRIWAGMKSSWARVSDALHLDAVTSRVRGAIAWTRAKVAAGMSLIGSNGVAGLALLGISTDAGRKVVGYALRPVGWVLKAFGLAYTWLEETIDNDGRGGIRQWIADRMVDGREFLFGNAGKQGIVNSAIIWIAQHFGSYLMVDSLPMRTLRAGGTALVAKRASALLLGRVAFVAGIPFIGLILTVGSLALTLMPFSPEISRGYEYVAGAFRSNAEQAEEIVESDIDEVKATTATAAAMAAGNVVPNRAQRRGTKKTTTARR